MRKALLVVAALAVGAALLASILLGSRPRRPVAGGDEATARERVLVARLSGAQEVPGPGDADGAGSARLRVLESERTLCFTLQWRRIAAPTAAHIHRGREGQEGRISLTLFAKKRNPAARGARACLRRVPAGLLRSLVRSPRNFYVNVHNARFPAGAIRGQLAHRAASVAWQRLAPALSKRTEVTAASRGPRIFVIGGFAESGETVAEVEVYESRANRWRAGPDLPIALNHAMSAESNGVVYVFGGYSGPGLSNPTDRAFALRAGGWTELPRMPEARAAAGAAAVGGKLYVAGGVEPAGLAGEMLVFDPSSQRWSSAPGPPTRREHLGVAGARGRLYVVGGRTSFGANLGATEAFDPRTGRWTKLPDMPTPRGGIAAAATSNGFVVAAGGESSTETFDEVEAFDTSSRRWRSLPRMPSPRHGLGVAAIDTLVYVVAGGPTPGFSFSNANEAIDLAPLRR